MPLPLYYSPSQHWVGYSLPNVSGRVHEGRSYARSQLRSQRGVVVAVAHGQRAIARRVEAEALVPRRAAEGRPHAPQAAHLEGIAADDEVGRDSNHGT
jgi:hypothetical protein